MNGPRPTMRKSGDSMVTLRVQHHLTRWQVATYLGLAAVNVIDPDEMAEGARPMGVARLWDLVREEVAFRGSVEDRAEDDECQAWANAQVDRMWPEDLA